MTEPTIYAVTPPALPTLPIVGRGELFPVHRIYCVGRNYAAHAREMGVDGREPPFFFMKPADAVVAGGGAVPYPPMTSNLHHEVELVVALRAGGVDVPVERALDLVYGYAVGLDLTRRDLQHAAKAQGKPWDMAKGFDASAPVSAIAPASSTGHPAAGLIELCVNGELRQRGDLGDMIWSVAEVLAHLSSFVELAPGDLVFTGTPEGVGAIAPGDRLEARIEGVGALAVDIAPPLSREPTSFIPAHTDRPA